MSKMSKSRNHLYGKRKRVIPECPNPLFVKILTDLRDEAEEKGWKCQYTYGKALYSLKKYPLPIPSGKGCKFLENFGDKICKLLDDKLPVYVSRQANEVTAEEGSASVPSHNAAVTRRATCEMKRQSSASSSGDRNTSPYSPEVKGQRSSSGSRRPYVPVFRSGPYALLLCLRNELQSAHSKGHMTKAELLRSAQPLCDKSFSIPDPWSRYTAWSSMGYLIKNGFIIKKSSPAIYSITGVGVDLAEKLDTATMSGISTNQTLDTIVPTTKQSSTQADSRVPDRIGQDSLGTYGVSDRVIAGSVATTLAGSEAETFLYHYIDESDVKMRHKDQAKVTIDDDIGLGFLITCRYTDLLRSGKTYSIDVSRPLGAEYIFAYLKDNDAEEISPCPPVLPKANINTQPLDNVEQSHPKASLNCRNQEGKSSSTTAQKIITPSPITRTFAPPTSVPSSVRGADATKTSCDLSVLGEPEFVLTPGAFEVVLCVDNREFYGSSSSGGKQLLPDLMKNGVQCDLRKLEAGDMLWVAKEKIHADATNKKGRELVLDYVIERKRMDDLVSSCVDGRLKEQKFRMSHSGLRRPMYLIEEYGSMKNYSLSEDRLRQTITNIQVIDKFQIKRTADTKESVAYLTVFTRYLQSVFTNKTLRAYKSEVLQEYPQHFDINSTTMCLMTFDDFNQSTVKTKPLNVKEMFGKQLVQMYRMSAESALAILNVHPTPSHLMEAYDKCKTEKERENLLSSLKLEKSGRNLGVVMSRQLYQFYYTNEALT